MRFRRTVIFRREFKALPPEIQKIARSKFVLFKSNWRHPSLRVHKLEGLFWHDHPIFDLWVTDRYRVLFILDGDTIVSIAIGPHKIVSK